MYRLDAIVLAVASIGLAADVVLSRPKAIDKPASDFRVATPDEGRKPWAAKGWPLHAGARDDKIRDDIGADLSTAAP